MATQHPAITEMDEKIKQALDIWAKFEREGDKIKLPKVTSSIFKYQSGWSEGDIYEGYEKLDRHIATNVEAVLKGLSDGEYNSITNVHLSTAWTSILNVYDVYDATIKKITPILKRRGVV